MVLSFALCASIAFAQTTRFVPGAKNESYKVSVSDIKAAPVDYKASIFTKDVPVDTIRLVTFSESDMTEVQYGETCKLNANDILDGVAVAGDRHTQTSLKSYWFHFADSADYRDNAPTVLPNISVSSQTTSDYRNFVLNRLGPARNGVADDGFMIISLNEVTGHVYRYNTYFTLPVVAKRDNTQTIEVRVTQAYAKYYDNCFIDYQVDGAWYSREVNVTGVDVEINSAAPYKIRWTMPHALVHEDSIALRVRMATLRMDGLYAYGYLWAVDNVAIVSNPNAYNWDLATERTIDGFYGQIPQGMSIPLSYAINANNLSGEGNAITNAHITAYAGAEGQPLVAVADGPTKTLAANDINAIYTLGLNERGFIDLDSLAPDAWNQGFYGENGPNYGAHFTPNATYPARSLPTATAGVNYYSMVAEGDNVASRVINADTVLYTVTSNYQSSEGSRSNLPGYRWGQDNGIIPSQSAFLVAFTDNDLVTNTDDNGHTSQQYYRVHMRFTTGNDIPTDGDGNPWVFRGIEYVVATDRGTSRIGNAMVQPLLYEEVYEDGTIYFNTVSAGIDGLQYGIDEEMLNDLSTGYILPSEEYEALCIKFMDEPVLKPNTTYRVGYVLTEPGQFAVAATETRFYATSDSTVSYLDNPATAPYYSQHAVGSPLDIIVNDPDEGHGGQITAYNIDNYPMIRPVVGPASPVDYADVVVLADNCNDSMSFCVTKGDEVACGESYTFSVPVGSSQRFYVDYPEDERFNHTVITAVYLDGVELELYDGMGDGDLFEYSANVYDADSNVLLYRSGYYFYMSQISDEVEHQIRVDLAWEPFRTTGIDPVAANVNLSMSPNPASSTVKLNVNGVEGMLNCNIIDMSGRVVYNANINAANETTIDVSEMPAGAYFVRITNDNMSKIEKLIIK